MSPYNRILINGAPATGVAAELHFQRWALDLAQETYWGAAGINALRANEIFHAGLRDGGYPLGQLARSGITLAEDTKPATLTRIGKRTFYVAGPGPVRYAVTVAKTTRFLELADHLTPAGLSWSDLGKVMAVLSAVGGEDDLAEAAAVIGLSYVDAYVA